jgi:putative endonuclease
MSARSYAVYILATRKDGPIYIGFTNDLDRRVAEHKSHEIKGHTAKYNIERLVYVEWFDDPVQAIEREKVLKTWRRVWKVALIERDNPEWNDLSGWGSEASG